jgi:hypothetical protein
MGRAMAQPWNAIREQAQANPMCRMVDQQERLAFIHRVRNTSPI